MLILWKRKLLQVRSRFSTT